MSHFLVGGEPHCVTRARERYGIELSLDDVKEIARRCFKREGLTHIEENGTQHHMIVFGERVLWVVYKPPTLTDNHRFGLIATINPATTANYQARRDSEHRMRRLRGKRR